MELPFSPNHSILPASQPVLAPNYYIRGLAGKSLNYQFVSRRQDSTGERCPDLPYRGGCPTNRLLKWCKSGNVCAVGQQIVCLFVCYLTSQQHASVSQGRICSDNFTCCHTEIQVADQTFHLTQSQYTDTGPTSPSADPITPGAWQGSHWSANF